MRPDSSGPEDEVAHRGSRTWTLLAIAMCVLIMFVVVQANAGIPGPGMLRRYAVADLNRVADRYNDEVPAPRAHVDLLRSRVVVETTDRLAACIPKDLAPDMAMMVTATGAPAGYCSGEPG